MDKRATDRTETVTIPCPAMQHAKTAVLRPCGKLYCTDVAVAGTCRCVRHTPSNPNKIQGFEIA